MRSLAESASRQLRAWADHLQNSPITGQRHLNDAVRRKDDQKKRMDAFEAELERIRKGGKPPEHWGKDDTQE